MMTLPAEAPALPPPPPQEKTYLPLQKNAIKSYLLGSFEEQLLSSNFEQSFLKPAKKSVVGAAVIRWQSLKLICRSRQTKYVT